MTGGGARRRAAEIRARILATVVRRAPQVMVKVTGGGRCMGAIAAHFRYISKNGKLEIEDERGETMSGKDALRPLVDDWRFGGSLIEEDVAPGQRREAFNIMLSMPRGTAPLIVQRAAREFARAELADHKYVIVLHDHQANRHVHISVRAESKHGKRLNPRETDLHCWRETFAEKLLETTDAWSRIAIALAASGDPHDWQLAIALVQFTRQAAGRVHPPTERGATVEPGPEAGRSC